METEKAPRKYWIHLFLYSVGIASIMYLLNNLLPERFQGNSWPYLLLFFVIITSVFHVIMSRIAQGNAQVFVRTFMGTTTIKLFLYLIIIVIYLLIDKAGSASFVLYFMLYYFLFTAFEVFKLFKMLKK